MCAKVDVHEFSGHIACGPASDSEIVIPVYHENRLTAVLDIDSPLIGRFTEGDRVGLERCAVLEKDAISEGSLRYGSGIF